MNYWVGILHTLNKNENQWLTVLGTFQKSQKIPSKKNKIVQIVKISSRKTQKKIANPQIDKLPQIIFRATRATGSYQFIDFRAHVHTVGARGIPTKLNVSLRETWLQKKSVLSVGTGAQFTSSRSNKLLRSQCIICSNYFQMEELQK